MENSKSAQYLKYAIGEIILVVIGILIALQINNWNQKRIDKKAEKEIIRKLNNDFKINEVALEKHLKSINGQINANKQLMLLIGSSAEELAKHNLDSLFGASMGNSDLAFADNTLNNLIQTDRLTLIKNDTLSDLLYQWGTLKEIRNKRTERTDSWVNDQYLPYLISKISFKEMDAYSNFDWAGKSKVKPDYYPLFQEVTLENYLDNILWYNQKLMDRNVEIKALIELILQETQSPDND